jgi:hypothetical protein
MMVSVCIDIEYAHTHSYNLAKKMPLGRLSKSQIQKGYEVLRQLSEELQKPKPANNTLVQLSSMFCEYTFLSSEKTRVNGHAQIRSFPMCSA